MNDHHAKPRDVVRRKTGGPYLTVNWVDTAAHELHTSQWTGGQDVVLDESEVDVLTPAGVTR